MSEVELDNSGREGRDEIAQISKQASKRVWQTPRVQPSRGVESGGVICKGSPAAWR